MWKKAKLCPKKFSNWSQSLLQTGCWLAWETGSGLVKLTGGQWVRLWGKRGNFLWKRPFTLSAHFHCNFISIWLLFYVFEHREVFSSKLIARFRSIQTDSDRSRKWSLEGILKGITLLSSDKPIVFCEKMAIVFVIVQCFLNFNKTFPDSESKVRLAPYIFGVFVPEIFSTIHFSLKQSFRLSGRTQMKSSSPRWPSSQTPSSWCSICHNPGLQ